MRFGRCPPLARKRACNPISQLYFGSLKSADWSASRHLAAGYGLSRERATAPPSGCAGLTHTLSSPVARACGVRLGVYRDRHNDAEISNGRIQR